MGDNQSIFGSLLSWGDINFPYFMGEDSKTLLSWGQKREHPALAPGEGSFGSPGILGIFIGLLKEDSVFSESKTQEREVWWAFEKWMIIEVQEGTKLLQALLGPSEIAECSSGVRRRQWHPTPVFLPGESQGRGSLVGFRLWGHAELDMTEVT